MGLILNNMSGALQGQQLTSNNVGRSFMAATGAFGFLPHVPGSTTADGHVAPVSNIFLDNKDAAFIVSGTVGGKDKAVFMGDLVVSGNLSLGDGSSFVDAAADADATRVAFFDDTNTVGGDADLLFIEAGKFDADSGGQGRLELGDSAGDDVSIKLAAGDLQLFTDDEGASKIAGLVTNNATKLSITGALSPVSGKALQGIEMGSDAGVILGQGGGGHSDAAAGFILVSALAGSGDAGADQPAVKVQAAAGGVEIDALKNIELDSAAKIIIDGNSDSADAVKINAGQGGIDILAAGAAGEDIDIVNNAGSVNIEGGESHADSVKITAGGGVNLDSSLLIDIDQSGDLGASAADGFNLKVANTNSATGADAMITLEADGKITLDSTDTSDGVVIAPTSGVPITLGTAAGTVLIPGSLDVNGTTTTIDATNTSITDGLIVLNSGSDASPANRDQGIIFAAPDVSRALFVDITDSSKFKFAQTYTSGSAAAVTPIGDADVEMGVLTATSVIVDDGLTVGSATTSDALTIASNGDLTLKEDLVFANGKLLGSATTKDLLTVNSDDLTVKGTKQVKVDIINESTGDAGVTIEGVAIVAGSSETTVGVAGDSDAIIFSNSAGTIQFSNTNDSSSSSSGPVTFAGGVGVAKDLNVGDDLRLDSNEAVVSLGATGKKISMSHVPASISVAFSSSGLTTKSGLNSLSGPSIVSDDTSIAFSGTVGAEFAEGEILVLVTNSTFGSADVMVFEVTSATPASASSLPVRYIDSPNFGAFSGGSPSSVVTNLSSSAVEIGSTLASTSETVNEVKNHLLYAGEIGVADSRLAFRAAANQIYSSASGLLDIEAGTKVAFAIASGAEVLSVGSSSVNLTQPLLPTSDNAVNLGSASARFANIFTGDLNLRNDRGDWTLIEENDFISFRNNKTGRRFRMVMEDITGLGNYGPGNDGEM